MSRILAAFLLVLALMAPSPAFADTGALVVVGGGGTGPEIIAKTLALAGGTSAGAAVLAEAMFTGDADLTSLIAGATVTGKGLGLWSEALIDQHFLKRQRDNRLISAVMDHPAMIGVGIDEGTAVVVQGKS